MFKTKSLFLCFVIFLFYIGCAIYNRSQIIKTDNTPVEQTTEPIIEEPEEEHKHIYEDYIEVEPTCESDGYTEYICYCGDSYKIYDVKKYGHSYKWYIITKCTPFQDGINKKICTRCHKVDDVETLHYQDIVNEQTKSRGIYGRLHIPDVNIDVALFKGDTSQATVDAKDSAAYFKFDGAWFIADHNTQAFSPLKKIKAGMKAYIVKSDGIETYVCLETTKGHNVGYGLVLADWETHIAWKYPDNVILYTCMDSAENIFCAILSREE